MCEKIGERASFTYSIQIDPMIVRGILAPTASPARVRMKVTEREREREKIAPGDNPDSFSVPEQRSLASFEIW